jgi:hypothetical protein
MLKRSDPGMESIMGKRSTVIDAVRRIGTISRLNSGQRRMHLKPMCELVVSRACGERAGAR